MGILYRNEYLSLLSITSFFHFISIMPTKRESSVLSEELQDTTIHEENHEEGEEEVSKKIYMLYM
jgi:hypothetical protein